VRQTLTLRLAVLKHLLLHAQLPPTGNSAKLPLQRPVALCGHGQDAAVQQPIVRRRPGRSYHRWCASWDVVPYGITCARFARMFSNDLAHVFNRSGGPRSVVALDVCANGRDAARPSNTIWLRAWAALGCRAVRQVNTSAAIPICTLWSRMSRIFLINVPATMRSAQTLTPQRKHRRQIVGWHQSQKLCCRAQLSLRDMLAVLLRAATCAEKPTQPRKPSLASQRPQARWLAHT